MASRDINFLWKEDFRDPPQFCGNRSSKSAPSTPVFRHRQTRDPLWIDASHNRPWVQEELRRSSKKDGELCGWKAAGEKEEFHDPIVLFELIKACGKQKDLRKGSSIHASILEKGLVGTHSKCSPLGISLSNALLSMYAKCGALAKAQEMFDELPARSVVTWNALISAYALHGLGDEALRHFRRMRDEGLSPNAITFICILKACGSIGAVEKGEEIHVEIDRQGLLENDNVLGTALVDMYAKCGVLAKAKEVFDKLPAPNVVTWNVLIAGYAQHGLGDEALSCFGQMRGKGLSPDAVTFICALQACGSIGATEKGDEIHTEISREGLLRKDILLGTALVDMYGKCGELTKAQEVFDELPTRDVVTWTALIAGYAHHGFGEEALSSFERMLDEGLFPNAVTFICLLKACGSIGATKTGEEIRAEVSRQGLLERDIVLGTALVDMYANCGELEKAQEVFDKLPTRDVAMWTALMAGYAQAAKVKTVFDSFSKMIGEGIEPDLITFGVLLVACSHAGLVEEGQMYYDTMSSVYGIIPSLEHRTCMVDIFSRAGHFEKAIGMIEKVLPSDCLLLWSALMGACQKWINVELGRWAFEHAIRLDEKCVAAYVCMCNIYAAAGMQEEAEEVEDLRMKNKAWKILERCWWTDVSRNVHSLTVGGRSHPQGKYINAKLKDINEKIRLEGYLPRLHRVSQADVLCGHSEKLAIALALINTPDGTPIRVVKNMHVCGDCHFVTSLISKMEKRKIQVTDANHIHFFADGKCTCEN